MKRAWLSLVVVLGASAVAAAEPAAPIAALVRGDAAAFASHAASPLLVRDLWFDTTPCQAFSGHQEVDAARVPALVRCLADLGVRPVGERAFQYGPGILIHGVFAEDGRLTVLVGPVPVVEGQPTIEGNALAEHVDGLSPTLTPGAELVRELRAKHAVAAALVTVCFDAAGRVSRADASASPSFPAYGTQALAVARRWRARPFAVHGARTPVCARLVFLYPMAHPRWLSLPVPPPPTFLADLAKPPPPPPPLAPAGGAAPSLPSGARIVAPTALEGHRTSGTVQIAPDDATRLDMQARHVSKLVGSWKICVDIAGKVSAVAPLRLTGSARYDAKIAAELAKWTYSPYEVDGKPVPVCTAVTFIYRQH